MSTIVAQKTETQLHLLMREFLYDPAPIPSTHTNPVPLFSYLPALHYSSQVKHFVLDECDRLLAEVDMRRDVQSIFKATPHDKQVMMFSATLDKEVRPICRKFCQNVSISCLYMKRSAGWQWMVGVLQCGQSYEVSALRTSLLVEDHML